MSHPVDFLRLARRLVKLAVEDPQASVPVCRWDDVLACASPVGPIVGRLHAHALEDSLRHDTTALDHLTPVSVHWGITEGQPVVTTEHLGGLTLPDWYDVTEEPML